MGHMGAQRASNVLNTSVGATAPRPKASGQTTNVTSVSAWSSAARRRGPSISANDGTSTSPMLSPICVAGMSARLYA